MLSCVGLVAVACGSEPRKSPPRSTPTFTDKQASLVVDTINDERTACGLDKLRRAKGKLVGVLESMPEHERDLAASAVVGNLGADFPASTDTPGADAMLSGRRGPRDGSQPFPESLMDRVPRIGGKAVRFTAWRTVALDFTGVARDNLRKYPFGLSAILDPRAEQVAVRRFHSVMFIAITIDDRKEMPRVVGWPCKAPTKGEHQAGQDAWFLVPERLSGPNGSSILVTGVRSGTFKLYPQKLRWCIGQACNRSAAAAAGADLFQVDSNQFTRWGNGPVWLERDKAKTRAYLGSPAPTPDMPDAVA